MSTLKIISPVRYRKPAKVMDDQYGNIPSSITLFLLEKNTESSVGRRVAVYFRVLYPALFSASWRAWHKTRVPGYLPAIFWKTPYPTRGWPKPNPSATLPNTDEKKHEALLKYTQNDVARTAEIMDVSTECRILVDYNHWACDAFDHAVLAGQEEVKAFLNALLREVIIDFLDVSEE